MSVALTGLDSFLSTVDVVYYLMVEYLTNDQMHVPNVAGSNPTSTNRIGEKH